MSLYREEILDHYKRPRNFGILHDAAMRAELNNIPCGDHVKVYCKTDDEKLKEMKFEGEGCALSIAATSMLSEAVRNKTFQAIDQMKESDMISMVTGGSLAAGRIPCVMLGLKALKMAIAERMQKTNGTGIQVTRDMNLGEVAARWPAARTVLLDYGLHCVGCFASSFDTIEAGAKVHGMSDQEIEEMVKEINRSIQSSSRT